MQKIFSKIVNKTLHLAVLIALLCSFVVAPTFMPATIIDAATPVPINMIYYGWHDNTVDQSIINANPEFLVDNSPAGPWKGNASISKFMSAGIKYFDYIDGGYEGTVPMSIPNDLASNLAYVNAIAAAGAYGVFIDEVSYNPNTAALSYLQQISDRAHSLGLVVVFNTGMNSWDDRLMNYCDFMNSSEVWNGGALTASQKKWASRTWFLTQNVNDATTAANLTKAAWALGIRASYVCNSYGSLPSWLATYISLISNTSPAVSTLSATNISANNATLNGNLSSLGSTATVSVNFDWGLTTSYGNTTLIQTMAGTGNYSAALPALTPNTSYHFRAKAAGTNTVYGSDMIFTTTSNVNRAPVLAAIGSKAVNEGALLSFTISATDADGDALTYAASNLPSGATFNASTRTFSWTPSYSQAGTYPAVRFSVTDGSATVSEDITITVSNVGQAPVLAAIGNKAVNEGALLSFTISATDADGDTLTYAASNLPSGATFNASTRTFAWTPNYSQAGTYAAVRFSVTDGSASDYEDITITVSNVGQAPVLAAIGNKAVNEGALLSFTISATDADGDTLTYAASNLPSGATFNASTRTFAWTPNYSQAGTYAAVRFSVTDGSASDYEDITITVSNVGQAPVLAAIGNKAVNEGALLSFTISATDADGDTLTYAASNLPSGATFNASTRTFSWTPSYSQAGTYAAVRFSVTDGSATVSEDITITVAHPYEDWDTNQDGAVNVLDLIINGQHWGESGTPGWIKEDVNHDGLINVLDTIVIGQHWTDAL